VAARQRSRRHSTQYLVDQLPVDWYAALGIQPELEIFPR
jgi:hypothetical protein